MEEWRKTLSAEQDKLCRVYSRITALWPASAETGCRGDDYAGMLYQALSRRGDRSVKGSFYTPQETADRMVASALQALDKAPEETDFLDPCCGNRPVYSSLHPLRRPT